MTDLYLADVSEFQGHVDWATYAKTNPAGIARVCYGTSHLDRQWAANLVGMRAHLRARIFYQYVVADQDIAAQARAFAALVGPLEPGEAAMADIEEGAGDLTAAGQLWQTTVHNLIGGAEGEYSGLAFAAAHLRNFAGVRIVWVAAYQRAEPAEPHALWQFTDRRAFPGIAAPCDASVFHGSIDELLALLNPAAPTPLRNDMFELIHNTVTNEIAAWSSGGAWWPVPSPAWAQVALSDSALCAGQRDVGQAEWDLLKAVAASARGPQ